jgi:N4-gp56 family major capsid protein
MLNYNAPTLVAGGTRSDVDATGTAQMNTFFWLKKAIITARKEQYFMPLASVTNMPKHFGKTIKVHEYVPLLDVRNSNDMGLDAAGAAYANGNLYGSSRDIGTINGRLPTLTENGGRVNRVGFTRLTREGSIFKFGFFTEFTQESLDFDSDDMLMDHLSRELLTGATQLTEAVLQRDLLAAAGVTIFAGAATTNATVTGEGAGAALVSYANLMRLDQTLTDNRTPKQTTVITGSRNVDTKTIPACRVLFIGSALVPTVKGLKDLFNNPAFIPVHQYADAGTVLNGEIGSVDNFRIIEVPEMLHWAGVGANVGTNPGYRATAGKYDVYPMLCIGEDSFTTIGFQTDGKTVKFNVMTKMPGRETATRESDPYGETGFSSIKWYYGILVKRPERIGLIKCVAPQ